MKHTDEQSFYAPEGGGQRLLPDPGVIKMIVRRRLPVFAVVFLLVLAVAAAILLTMTPVYTASASLLLQPQERELVQVSQQPGRMPVDENLVSTTVQMIRRPAVGLRVVQTLDLDEREGFIDNGDGQAAAALSGESVMIDGAIATPAELAALQTLLDMVDVARVGTTYVVDVYAYSPSPELAAEVANAYASSYLALQAEGRQSTGREDAERITQRAEELRQQALTDDAALQRFRIANNLMGVEGASMAEQEISQLNQQIAMARAELATAQGRYSAAQRQLARGGGGGDSATALAAPTVSALRQERSRLSAELADLSARYGPRYPQYIQAQAELAEVDRELNAELQRVQSSLRAEVQVAQSNLNSLLGSQGRAAGNLRSNEAAQVGLQELERRAEVSEAVYNAFLTRAQEITQQSELPHADATLSSAAGTPEEPTSPNFRLGALFALIGAFVAGVAAIGAAEYLDSGIRTRRDVEKKVGTPYAGSIPDPATSGKGVGAELLTNYVLSRPYSLFAESFRKLGAFLFSGAGHRARVIAITSPLPRDGKTTASICLARTMATSHKRTVLVDFDIRRHSSSDMLIREPQGEPLFEYFDGRRTLDEALVKDELSDLMILPTHGPNSPADSLTPERIERLFTELRERFEAIIVDSGPALGLAETQLISQAADRTIVVARWGKTAVQAVRAAIDSVEQNGPKVAGVVLTGVNVKQYASTGLDDIYGYHKKFKGYYQD